MREFAKFGQILKAGSFSAEDANWVHVCFGHRDEAERALRYGKDGLRPAEFTSGLIIGVKRLDPHQRAALSGVSWPYVQSRIHSLALPLPDPAPEDNASNPPLLNEPVPHAASLVARPYVVTKPAAGTGTLTSVAPDTSLVWKLQHWAIGL